VGLDIVQPGSDFAPGLMLEHFLDSGRSDLKQKWSSFSCDKPKRTAKSRLPSGDAAAMSRPSLTPVPTDRPRADDEFG